MRPFDPNAQMPAGATILGAALDGAVARLREAGVEQPRFEARCLAAHLLGKPAVALLDRATRIDGVAFAALVERRAGREPMAFITGRQGFWTLDLAVSPATLIPRADSETLIEASLAALPDRARVGGVLDLGTGTGCLLLAALSEFPRAFGLGVDVSPDAAKLARHNAERSGLTDRASFAAGDWAACVAGRFDLVLCNPPYIEAADLAGLMPEVIRHEPRRALDGGRSGLDAYAALLPELPRLLAPDGVAVFELGAGQAGPVAALAKAAGFAQITSYPDLAGIERALVLRA